MNHDLHTRLEMLELSTAELEDAMIYNQSDMKMGRISHLRGDGADAQVIVDVGTFLGMGGRRVAIPVSSLEFMRDEDDNIHATTRWSKEQIDALPDHHDD